MKWKNYTTIKYDKKITYKMVSPWKELQQYGSCGGVVEKRLQIKN
jgi:hypothetical protein